MTTRRLIITIACIAVGQTLLALAAFAAAFAIGDGGGAVPGWLYASSYVLAIPGVYLAAMLQEALGDPASSLVGFAIGGILWGCVLGLLLKYVLSRHRHTRAPAA